MTATEHRRFSLVRIATVTTKSTPANPRPTRPGVCDRTALQVDPETGLTNSEHHHQLLAGVGALENADTARSDVAGLPPIRAGPAAPKPPVAYSISEAAR